MAPDVLSPGDARRLKPLPGGVEVVGNPQAIGQRDAVNHQQGYSCRYQGSHQDHLSVMREPTRGSTKAVIKGQYDSRQGNAGDPSADPLGHPCCPHQHPEHGYRGQYKKRFAEESQIAGEQKTQTG